MKMMGILTLKPEYKPRDLEKLQPDEERRTWELYQSDVIREVYIRGDELLGAIVVIEAESEEQAVSFLEQVPAVAHKLFEVELFPLKPWKPLEALFG